MMASACATAACRLAWPCCDYAGEVVDRVEVDVFELLDFGFDVARHGQVDHEHRPVLAGLERALDGAQADERQRCWRCS